MKWLVAIATFLVVLAGKAQTQDGFGNWTAASSANLVTNAVPTATVTNFGGASLYHTYQVGGTNAVWFAVDRSLDRTNWYLGTTNAVAAGGVGEATVTGKYQYFRVRIQGTNVGATINYMGGR